MLKFIDTHAHLEDPIYEGQIEKVRSNYLSDGIFAVINVACSKETTSQVYNRAKSFEEVYFSVGCHPQSASQVDESFIEYINQFSSDKKCLAVGEIGLDYYYKPFDRDVQIKAFERQIEYAISVNLPIIVHTRNATKDTVDIIKSYSKSLNGKFLMHCYAESKEITKILLDVGGYFAYGGASTFKNYKKHDVIKYIPLDRIMCETDCPYMTPEPHRGKVNEPCNVKYVYEQIAKVKEVELEKLASFVEENFKRLFTKYN